MKSSDSLVGKTIVQQVPEQLSGVAVVIIIAVGVQTFIMLFIFAKRQIMRFTLRSRRGPHISVGQGGVKAFRREIDRRLDYASHIKHEPRLCNDDAAQRTSHDLKKKYSDRMLAVDQCADLSSIIARYGADCLRPAGSNLRSFLIECLSGPLAGADPKQIHKFCDLYEHARHSYHPFSKLDYNNYINLLSELKSLALKNLRNRPDNSKTVDIASSQTKLVNRPNKRIESSPFCSSGISGSNAVRRNSSTVRLVSSHDNFSVQV